MRRQTFVSDNAFNKNVAHSKIWVGATRSVVGESPLDITSTPVSRVTAFRSLRLDSSSSNTLLGLIERLAA